MYIFFYQLIVTFAKFPHIYENQQRFSAEKLILILSMFILSFFFVFMFYFRN